ncbi:hypothetical protein BHE74_00055247 [Ensete ventricosum]|nr:hypothetical protein BHE74_00055247 [Ensete ventricosum]
MPSRSLERDRRQTRNRALQKLRTNGWLPADALTVSYTGGIASVRRPRRAHRLRPKSRTKLRVGGDHSSILRRFTGNFISPLGTTTLPVTIGEELHTKTLMVLFMVVDLTSANNAIIGRPTLNKLRVVLLTFHRSMKFSTNVGVDKTHSDLRESRRCYLITSTLPKKPRIPSLVTDPREPDKLTLNLEPVEGVKEGTCRLQPRNLNGQPPGPRDLTT